MSVEHGWHVFWSPKGDRLYYHAYNSVMEVEVSTDPFLRLGTPRSFIDPDSSTPSLQGNGIAVTKDGKRFVGIRGVETEGEDEVGGGNSCGIELVFGVSGVGPIRVRESYGRAWNPWPPIEAMDNNWGAVSEKA